MSSTMQIPEAVAPKEMAPKEMGMVRHLPPIPHPWASSDEAILKDLRSDRMRGLSQEEARLRRESLGDNVLALEKRESKLLKFLAQFKSPVVVILLVATVISALLGEVVDAIAIVSIVIINAIVGYLQEIKAEAAVQALKKLSAPRARVLREGQVIETPASGVTVGDILVLEAGDYVSADARLIVAGQLSSDEAVLTGESLPVTKSLSQVSESSALGDRADMVFAGTTIATGSGRAVVTAIGMGTEIGRIAGMIEEAELEDTPLQARLEQVGTRLLYLCLGVVVAVGILGLVHGEKWIDVLMTAISLAVAAVPEGLPAIVTIALALAIHRMTRKNAIVRHLPAVETLGSTDVICTDKTGTLTTGKMAVREVLLVPTSVIRAGSHDADSSSGFLALAKSGALCSNASLTANGEGTGDPTEVALLKLASEHGISPGQTQAASPRRYEWAFESGRKRMSVAVQEAGAVRLHVKGAPESVLPLCRLNDRERSEWERAVTDLSRQGRRLLAIATRSLPVGEAGFSGKDNPGPDSVERELDLLGVVAIADPPRPEAIAAVRDCKEAGIKVIMITGDHPATAKAIAVELGIVEPGRFEGVLTGPELEKLGPEELRKRAGETAVYARVTPEHKLRIVSAWKERGSVVAMTGDGVNDAPALKSASIGISMGRGGTEVARQASSMILADDNFATIVSAVEEGRVIYGNIRRSIQYLLSGNLGEILIMFGAAAMGWPTPLAPIHLLWINLVTDGLPSLALAAEPVPPNALRNSARPSPGSFFDRRFYGEMTFIGVTITLLALAVYGYSLHHEDEITARTHVFSFLVFSELFRSFASRSDTKTWFQMGWRSNRFHLWAVVLPVAFQIALHHAPFFDDLFKVKNLGWTECLILLGLTLIPVSVIEIRKLVRQKA